MDNILVLLEPTENLKLAIELLEKYYCILINPEISDHNLEFDLCLADGINLKKNQARLIKYQQECKPIFLPILLLTEDKNTNLASYNLRYSVNEIIVTPITRLELLLRIEVLLHCRHLSLQLQTTLETEENLRKQLEIANQKLSYLAITDGLTQIANRRHFDEHLKQEWERLAREKQPLSLILCDLDFFKRYNDHYGHQWGDRALQQIAEILTDCAQRPGDLVARYAGDEFAIILSNTSSQGAIHVASLVRESVKSLSISDQTSAIQPYLTLSLGIATRIPIATVNPQQLIIEADEALCRAKNQGRDRLILFNI